MQALKAKEIFQTALHKTDAARQRIANKRHQSTPVPNWTEAHFQALKGLQNPQIDVFLDSVYDTKSAWKQHIPN